jgi:uncharacterized protein (DUF58 family)
MEATRRAWTIGVTALLLVALALVTQRPVLLLGAATIGAWLITHQFLFARRAARLDAEIEVRQSLTPARVAPESTATISLSLSVPEGSPLSVQAHGRPPVAGSLTNEADGLPTVRIKRGEQMASIEFDVSMPVAGVHNVAQAVLHLSDTHGLFTETICRGPEPSLTVEPRNPEDIHIGTGGESIAIAYGEHSAGQLGSGLEPAEVRKYVPGDSLNRIDWKATARLSEAHVRDYEAETDRTTVLLIDHRSNTALGVEGRRIVDYLGEVALTYIGSARALGDPLGCYTIGNGGLTAAEQPSANQQAYTTIQDIVTELSPTDASEPHRSITSQYEARTPAEARQDALVLADDETTFAATLQPFFKAANPYVERIESDPLFAATRSRLTRLRGLTWTIILTDDSNRAELREAIKAARRGDNQVVAFIAPRCLFEPGSITDLESTYDRYLDFEGFRRDLASLPRVEAFEVAPGDRIRNLLSQRKRRREGPETVSGDARTGTRQQQSTNEPSGWPEGTGGIATDE